MAAALALLTATGCVPAGGTDSASTASDEEAMLAFHECLRDNGLEVADPEPGEGIGPLDLDRDDPATTAVVEDCSEEHLATSGGRVTVGGGGDNMADLSALVDYVDCMRDHGVDMPDPEPDGLLPLGDDLDPQSSEFQAAADECAEHLDGGGIRMGDPDGDGGMMGSR